MPDVTILGSGSTARLCSELLANAGFSLRHSFDLDDSADHAPVILGEVNGAVGLARAVVETGRHLLLAGETQPPVDRLALLLEGRQRNQAVFVWNERRYHPGYRLVRGLVETDPSWRPRFLRLETLATDPATLGNSRWRLLESMALFHALTHAAPLSVIASAAASPLRAANDFISLSFSCRDLAACALVGLGEAVDRRETVIAANGRKAFIDELNPSLPVRLIDEDADAHHSAPARWVSCPAPTPQELARQQVFAFLEGTLKPAQAQEEAEAWSLSLALLRAAEVSLQRGGASVDVEDRPESRLRLMPRFFAPGAGRGRPATRPSVS